ncbi:MAG: c-type cytochrome [Planctomycetes bacterium]|nr:c-type cytochrome [Planctomycetota bacterium]
MPPSFSPGEELLKLTEGLEDEEEIAIYQDLQGQVTAVLREHAGTPEKPLLLGNREPTDAENGQLKRGYQLYSKYCVQCHGVNGDGNGAVAEHLNPKPRNYTHGIFKFTSTPYGHKPRRSDLIHIIKRGVTGTSMPSFDRFSKEDLEAVVDYVLVLAYRGELERALAMIAYDDEELPDEEGIEEVVESILQPWRDSSTELVMPVTMMPPMTEESARVGHQLFLKHACNKCHGMFGRGGSMGNVEVGADAWGYKTAAADLSSGMFRGGGRPLDIYRRIHSGINGTPMPAFEKLFAENPDAIWQLVHFIKQTGNRRRLGLEPLGEADLPPGLEVPVAAMAEATNKEAPEAEKSDVAEPKETAEADDADEDKAEGEVEEPAEKASDKTEEPAKDATEESSDQAP